MDAELVAGDICNPADVRKAVKGCEVVFHLAALFSFWGKHSRRMHKVNVEGTDLLLRTCIEESVRTVIYTSSITIFGGQGKESASEYSSFRLGDTGSVYVKTKHDAHNLACQYRALGLDVRIAAPTHPIGPGDYGPTPTGQMFLDMLNQPVQISFDTEMNFIDVRDCARAHVDILVRGEPSETYILGGRNMHYREYLDLVNRVVGIQRPRVHIPSQVLTIAATMLEWISENLSMKRPPITAAEMAIARKGMKADSRKAERVLGLKPRPLEESIRDALMWFAQYGYISNRQVLEHLDQLEVVSSGTVSPGTLN